MANQVHFSDIVRGLQQDDWKFDVSDDNTIRLGFAGKNGRFQVIVRFLKEKDLVQILTFYPFNVAENFRPMICEVITRMNYGLLFCSCEMDMNDGEVRCRGSMPVDEAPFYWEQFRTILITTITTADRYYPAFMAVIFGGKNAKDAITDVESQKA